jgi:GrpB-like predicted nucleotidyltransferase (UPF0157 family)
MSTRDPEGCTPWTEVAEEMTRRTGEAMTARDAGAAAAEARRKLRQLLAADPLIRERVAELGGELPQETSDEPRREAGGDD